VFRLLSEPYFGGKLIRAFVAEKIQGFKDYFGGWAAVVERSRDQPIFKDYLRWAPFGRFKNSKKICGFQCFRALVAIIFVSRSLSGSWLLIHAFVSRWLCGSSRVISDRNSWVSMTKHPSGYIHQPIYEHMFGYLLIFLSQGRILRFLLI